MDWLKGMDDATFLKPIYMAAVLSPLVLISEMPLGLASLSAVTEFHVLIGAIYDKN